MRATATLYTRNTGEPYQKVEFKNGKPLPPKDYDGAYYLRLSENGKRTWKYFATIDDALNAQANLETNFDRARKGIAPLPAVVAASQPEGTIAAAVAEFIAYSESREADWHTGGDNGLAPNSVVAYRKAMENFAASCAEFGATRMAEFQDDARGEAILLNFKNWLLDKENVRRKPGKLGQARPVHSDSRKFTVVGQFLARNNIKMKTDRTFNKQDAGLVDYKDVPRRKKKSVKETVYYTPSDIRALLKAADGVHEKSNFLSDDLKDLVLLMLCTGMRDEEIQHLTWQNVNWANGDGKMKITVEDKPQYKWRVKDHEKRIVSPDKNAMLKARLQARQAGRGDRAKHSGSELLFPTGIGTPDQNFADRINACIKRATDGGYDFSRPEASCGKVLHHFRASYATYQHYVHGVPVRTLQADLGHSSSSTTEGYLAYIAADEIAAVRKAYEAIK